VRGLDERRGDGEPVALGADEADRFDAFEQRAPALHGLELWKAEHLDVRLHLVFFDAALGTRDQRAVLRNAEQVVAGVVDGSDTLEPRQSIGPQPQARLGRDRRARAAVVRDRDRTRMLAHRATRLKLFCSPRRQRIAGDDEAAIRGYGREVASFQVRHDLGGGQARATRRGE